MHALCFRKFSRIRQSAPPASVSACPQTVQVSLYLLQNACVADLTGFLSRLSEAHRAEDTQSAELRVGYFRNTGSECTVGVVNVWFLATATTLCAKKGLALLQAWNTGGVSPTGRSRLSDSCGDLLVRGSASPLSARAHSACVHPPPLQGHEYAMLGYCGSSVRN